MSKDHAKVSYDYYATALGAGLTGSRVDGPAATAVVDEWSRMVMEQIDWAYRDAAAKTTTVTVRTHTEGVDEERTRILSILDQIKPPEEPYSRREWAWEQKGARDMWEKVRAMVESGQQPKVMGD